MSPNRRVRVDRSVRTHTSEHLTGRRVTSPSLCIQQLNRVQDFLAAGHETAIYAPAAGAGSVRSDPARRNANRAERARKTTGAECSSRRVQNARIVIENSAENRRSVRVWRAPPRCRRRTLRPVSTVPVDPTCSTLPPGIAPRADWACRCRTARLRPGGRWRCRSAAFGAARVWSCVVMRCRFAPMRTSVTRVTRHS